MEEQQNLSAVQAASEAGPELNQNGDAPSAVSEAVALGDEQSFALRFLLLLGVLVGILVILFYLLPGSPKLLDTSPAAVESAADDATQHVASEKGFFPQVEVFAEAAIVLDAETGEILYSKNGSAQLPLASLTKLMTVLVASELFNDTDALTISADALEGEGGGGLVPEEAWLSRDLFAFTLIQSSNGGARAIASAAGALPELHAEDYETAERKFIELMNQKAESLGLSQTYFINETGLDETEQTGGGYGSARDAAYLMSALMEARPDLLEGTRHTAVELSTLTNQSHIAINTNQNIGMIPGLIGSKTGYTALAGGNLVISFDVGVGKPIVIAVMGSTRDGRFSDVASLVEATFKYFASQS